MLGKYKMKYSIFIYREREYSCMVGKKIGKLKLFVG